MVLSRVLQIHGQLQVVLVVLELRLRVGENLNDHDHVARAALRSNVLYVTVRYSDRRHRDLSFDSEAYACCLLAIENGMVPSPVSLRLTCASCTSAPSHCTPSTWLQV